MPGTSSDSTPRSYFLTITTASDVQKVLQAEGPQLLFLRDPYCPISQDADDEIRALGVAVPAIDVSQSRELSRLVQETTGIKHESPQAIVIRNGQPSWHASHGAITREAVAAALEPTEATS